VFQQLFWTKCDAAGSVHFVALGAGASSSVTSRLIGSLALCLGGRAMIVESYGRMFVMKTAISRASATKTKATSMSVLWVFVAFVALFGVGWSGRYIPGRNLIQALDTILVAVAALAGVVGGMKLAHSQIALSILQLEQAEELAKRRDEALIVAIESLTEELRRRPTPIETVNFSLFGAKSK
jgi:hypothetical protein